MLETSDTGIGAVSPYELIDAIIQNSSANNSNTNPVFRFLETRYEIFNPEINNFSFMCGLVDKYKGSLLHFRVVDRKFYAHGNGANKQVYHKLWKEIIDLSNNAMMINIKSYFMDVNINHNFWDSDDNIKHFVIFVAMTVSSHCSLPFHFAPGLLEAIANKKLTLEELEFFMEKIDCESLKFAKKINPSDFKSLDTSFDTHEEFYRSVIIGNITEKQKAIYQSIASNFEYFDAFNDFTIQLIDKTFSGVYSITVDMVIPLFIFTNEQYLPLWEQFVRSLSEMEMRQMLVAFTNDCSLNTKIKINVTEMLNIDIKISVCFNTVCIHKKLFEKIEYLNNLKYYFEDHDQIVDGYIDNSPELLYGSNIHDSYIHSRSRLSGRRVASEEMPKLLMVILIIARNY